MIYSNLTNATYSVAVNPLTGRRSHRLDYTDPKGVSRAFVHPETEQLPIGTPGDKVRAYFARKPAEKSKPSVPSSVSIDDIAFA